MTADMKAMKKDVKDEVQKLIEGQDGQFIVNEMAAILENIASLISESKDGQELVKMVMMFNALSEEGRLECKGMRKTLTSEDGNVVIAFSPKSTSFRVSPEEHKEILKRCPDACSVSKTKLMEQAPELFAKFNDDAHTVQTGYEKASVTDKTGYQKMLDEIRKYYERIAEIMATYGQQ